MNLNKTDFRVQTALISTAIFFLLITLIFIGTQLALIGMLAMWLMLYCIFFTLIFQTIMSVIHLKKTNKWYYAVYIIANALIFTSSIYIISARLRIESEYHIWIILLLALIILSNYYFVVKKFIVERKESE